MRLSLLAILFLMTAVLILIVANLDGRLDQLEKERQYTMTKDEIIERTLQVLTIPPDEQRSIQDFFNNFPDPITDPCLVKMMRAAMRAFGQSLQENRPVTPEELAGVEVLARECREKAK